MEVVLRPVNDSFLEEVVFPAFEQGVVDAVPGVEHILRSVTDEHTRVDLELLLDRGIDGSFFGLDDEKWTSACYRLLFSEWVKAPDGWSLAGQLQGYAGHWEDTLHLALMLEDEHYPYADETRAAPYRRAVADSHFAEAGLASLICGRWDPVPSFPPDQILTVQGHGEYKPHQGVARADWAWRQMQVVNQWAAQLPNALSRLLQRESKRLRPVEAPERHEVLEYWLGRNRNPPLLAVTFSGLGPRAAVWIREIGNLARLVRSAAAAEQGLTAIITHRGQEGDAGVA